MYEVTDPLNTWFVEAEGRVHVAEPNADRFLCGRPIGDAQQVQGWHRHPGCWRCLGVDATEPVRRG